MRRLPSVRVRILVAASAVSCFGLAACTQTPPPEPPPPAAAQAAPQPSPPPPAPPPVNQESRSQPKAQPTPAPAAPPPAEPAPLPEPAPAPLSPLAPPPASVAPAPLAQTTAVSPFVPRWILYGWFFQNAVYLDRLADQLGSSPTADRLRRRIQLALGLTESQAAIVMEIASDCNRIVEDLSSKFATASRTGSKPPNPRTQAQLGKLAASMIEAIETHADDLRSRLGSDVFDRLDVYVHRSYGTTFGMPIATTAGVPGVVPLPVAPAPPGYPRSNVVPFQPAPPPAQRPEPVPATPNPQAPAPAPRPDEDAATVTVLAADPDSRTSLYAGTAKGIYATTGTDTWAFSGGPLADASITAVTIRSGVAYAATAADGIFRSSDKGKTWTAINAGLGSKSVNTLASGEDSNSKYLYAGTNGGIFRRNPLGDNWEPAGAGQTDPAITAIGFFKEALYAGSQAGRLFKSTDGGSTWSEEVVVPWNGQVKAITSAGDALFVAAESGLFRKSSGAQAWSAADAGLPSVNMAALVVSPDTPASIYAVIHEGVWASSNGGSSWTQVTETPPSAFAFDPGSASTLYAGVRGTVMKSTDGGKSWRTTRLKRPAT
jgi:photosystem II stability/assembly factor-like uncharacterized protein